MSVVHIILPKENDRIDLAVRTALQRCGAGPCLVATAKSWQKWKIDGAFPIGGRVAILRSDIPQNHLEKVLRAHPTPLVWWHPPRGTTDSGSCNIDELRKTFTSMKDNSCWKDLEIYPFSLGAPVKRSWDTSVGQVCPGSAIPPAPESRVFDELDEAAKLARIHFGCFGQLKKVLEALFPVYIILLEAEASSLASGSSIELSGETVRPFIGLPAPLRGAGVSDSANELPWLDEILAEGTKPGRPPLRSDTPEKHDLIEMLKEALRLGTQAAAGGTTCGVSATCKITLPSDTQFSSKRIKGLFALLEIEPNLAQ